MSLFHKFYTIFDALEPKLLKLQLLRYKKSDLSYQIRVIIVSTRA